MILFLDFDGVLHSCDAGDDALFVSVPYLWQILRRRPEIEVAVVSIDKPLACQLIVKLAASA